MPPANISADTTEVDALLRELMSRAEDASPAFAAVGRTLVNFIRLCFSTSRSPYGASWLPIKFRAPKVQQIAGRYGGLFDRRDRAGNLVFTAAGKKQSAANVLAAKGGGSAGKPLVDTGALRNSFTFVSDSSGVVIGTASRQARLQNFGGRVVPKRAKALAFMGSAGQLVVSRGVTIPARPFMPINAAGDVVMPPAWSKAVARSIADHFKIGASA